MCEAAVDDVSLMPKGEVEVMRGMRPKRSKTEGKVRHCEAKGRLAGCHRRAGGQKGEA